MKKYMLSPLLMTLESSFLVISLVIITFSKSSFIYCVSPLLPYTCHLSTYIFVSQVWYKLPQTGRLKQQKCIVSSWKTTSLRSRCHRVDFFLGIQASTYSRPYFSSSVICWPSSVFLSLWLHHLTSAFIFIYMEFSCV